MDNFDVFKNVADIPSTIKISMVALQKHSFTLQKNYPGHAEYFLHFVSGRGVPSLIAVMSAKRFFDALPYDGALISSYLVILSKYMNLK